MLDIHRAKRDVFAGAVIMAELLNRQTAWEGVPKDEISYQVVNGGRLAIVE